MSNRPFFLKSKIVINNSSVSTIGKVIINKNVEDKSNYIQVLEKESKELFTDGYLGYIFIDWCPSEIDDKNYAINVNCVETLKDYDVVEFDKEYIHVLYRDDSDDNFIQVTNQCNSNCIMCPDSDFVRNTDKSYDLLRLERIINCIPDDTKNVCITGGEPGILKYDLIKILKKCKECLLNTNFLLLSNGRVFSDFKFTEEFSKVLPYNFKIAIPLYANNATLHDLITRADGSFYETISGIKNLLSQKVRIEIRIVVLKMNYLELEKISQYIAKEIKNVEIVNFMALEMSGNAYTNRDNVWIDFSKATSKLYPAIITLIKSGINTGIYNFPLCKVDKRLFSLCRKSISDYKIRFKDECQNCTIKEFCGGYFGSTLNFDEDGE